MTGKRRVSPRDLLPLSKASKVSRGEPTGEAFRPEWIDFERGIRVGNLEPHERVTQILKHHLEQCYGTPFVTDRWGRGVFWQWICWLPKANRQAKPLSHGYNFGCAKLFIGLDRGARVFQSGLQVERGYMTRSSDYPGNVLREDWDWHRLIRQCRKGSALDAELRRLLGKEGFVAELGDFEHNLVLDKASFTSAGQLRAAASRAPRDRWVGFQLYYPMPELELRSCTGYELIGAVRAVFAEVLPAMNLCLQVPLEARETGSGLKGGSARPPRAGPPPG
jgi:hypothetical protein